MTDTPASPAAPPAAAAEAAEVDAILAEFGGDARQAIAALLHDLAVLATDRSNVVSFGFVRGQPWQPGRRA